MYVIVSLVILVLSIFLDLGVSIGAAFLLTWLLPNISFEIAVVISAICIKSAFYFLVKLMSSITEQEMYNLDKTYRVEEEYDDDLEEDVEYIVLPPTPSQSKRKKRPKRRR